MKFSAFTSADVRAYAKEYDVSVEVMDRFVRRFAPGVAEDGQFAQKADIVLFVHIPKTAGMSVGKSLQGSFDVFRPVEWNNLNGSFRAHTREACYRQTRRDGRQVIMGHFSWVELQMWRNNEMPMKCASILRQPVARFVSHYTYNCSDAHPAQEDFRKRYPTMADYARVLPYDMQVTQMTGTNASFEGLLEKLMRHYSFLGVTEHLAASLRHLATSHGLPVPEEFRENAARVPFGGDVDPEVIAIVEGKSVNDQRLHSLLSHLYA